MGEELENRENSNPSLSARPTAHPFFPITYTVLKLLGVHFSAKVDTKRLSERSL
jgi:hypothetical protein